MLKSATPSTRLSPRWGKPLSLPCRARLSGVLILATYAIALSAGEPDARGRQFIGLADLSHFNQALEKGGPTILTSPEISARIDFTELIVSWNASLGTNSQLTVQARVMYPESSTKFYTLGVWSPEFASHSRHSVPHQLDDAGRVSTDTLILQRPARRFQLRLTVEGNSIEALKFLGISLCDASIALKSLPPDKAAWAKILAVPERSQMPYPNGKVWCSPTTVSMLLSFWSQELNRPELDRPVPEVANAVFDAEWNGTGNWPFNMAFPGSLPGLRAYVTRLSDLSELEEWIAQGIPVGLSLDYDRLRAKGPGPNGHLVVCVGFTENGDPVINDPGTSKHVRKTFPRANLIDAWSCSRNTVYLVYPETARTPNDRFAHWDSPKTRQ